MTHPFASPRRLRRVAVAAAAMIALWCAAGTAAASESGTVDLVTSFERDYVTFDHAGGTVTGGILRGTTTVTGSSGGPFAEGESNLVVCLVYARTRMPAWTWKRLARTRTRRATHGSGWRRGLRAIPKPVAAAMGDGSFLVAPASMPASAAPAPTPPVISRTTGPFRWRVASGESRDPLAWRRHGLAACSSSGRRPVRPPACRERLEAVS